MRRKWIGEIDEELGIKFLFRSNVISRNNSIYNHNIVVAENPAIGRFLLLGKKEEPVLQIAEKYDFYSEMLVHVPLALCEKVERILVIGGGDGSVVREVIKHSVKHVDLVEIDPEVVKVAKKYLKLDEGALEKVNIINDDGANFVKKCETKYNVVICDITDPYPDDPASSLINDEFFRNLSNITEDVATIQSGSPIFQSDILSRFYTLASRNFKYAWVYLGVMPIYVGGLWSFTLMSNKKIDPEISRFPSSIPTNYYSPEIHKAAFVLPPFVRKILGR